MSNQPAPLVSLQQLEPAQRLFRHSARPEWGIGLWVLEERTRRSVRFEDGQTRAFKKGYYHFLEPVDVEKIDVNEVFSRMVDEADRSDALARRAASSDRKPVMSFKEQVLVFEHLYPGGLQGDAYIEANRSPAEGRKPKKAHIDRAVALAAEALAPEVLAQAIEEGNYAAVHDAAIRVLSATSLVSPSRSVRPLKELDEGQIEVFAKTLYDLLHGEDVFVERFGRWLDTLRRTCEIDVRWPLATAILSLYDPQNYVCIKAKPFTLQARTVAKGSLVDDLPTSRGYNQGWRVAEAVKKRLDDADAGVRDFLDVRTFIWETLRPKGQSQLENATST